MYDEQGMVRRDGGILRRGDDEMMSKERARGAKCDERSPAC